MNNIKTNYEITSNRSYRDYKESINLLQFDADLIEFLEKNISEKTKQDTTEYIEELENEILGKGYKKEDIETSISVIIDIINKGEIIYDILIESKTKHFIKTRELRRKDIAFISSSFDKERNNDGEKIKSHLQYFFYESELFELKEENKYLQKRNEELSDEIDELENKKDEDEDED